MTLYWVKPSPTNSGILAFHLNVLGCTMGNAYLVISSGILFKRNLPPATRKKHIHWNRWHTNTQKFWTIARHDGWWKNTRTQLRHTQNGDVSSKATTYCQWNLNGKQNGTLGPLHVSGIDSDLCSVWIFFEAGIAVCCSPCSKKGAVKQISKNWMIQFATVKCKDA